MATSSSSTLVELTSDVTIAVEQLKELGDQLMQGVSHNFSPDDMRNIDAITSYLKQLDLKRQEAHEFLEAETIKNSIIRRKLETFPYKLRAEINAKTKSARDSNATHINELQLRVSEVSDRAEQSKRSHELLKMHNELLELECKKRSEQHSELVKKMNNCMSEKNKMQIKLNETNQSLREAEEHIKFSREEIEKVEKGMEMVMKKFTDDVLTLNKTMITVKDKIKRQEEEKVELERTLEPLQDDLIQQEKITKDEICALERVKSNLRMATALEIELNRKLTLGAEEIECIKFRCETIDSDAVVMRKDYQTKEKEVLEKIDQFRKEVVLVLVDTKGLSTIRKGSVKDLKFISKDANLQASELQDLQDRVAVSKSSLLLQAEEGAKLSLDYKKLLYSRNELNIYHNGAVQLLMDEINELEDKITTERKTKDILMDMSGKLTASIEAYSTHHTETMSKMECKMTSDQRQGSDMSYQIRELQKITKEEDEFRKTLEQRLASACEHLKETRDNLTSDVQTLEEDVADFTDELYDHNEIIEKLEPQSVDLERELSERKECYEINKRELIGLKSNKSDIEDRIKTIGKDLEKIHAPQEKLKMDSLRCRAYTRQRLRQRDKEVEELEKQVMTGNQKLQVIDGENERIIQVSKKLSKEVERLKTLLRSSQDMESQLDSALKTYREDLEEQWKKNDELEKLSSAKDKVILKDITAMRKESGKRHTIISSIHERFEEGLEDFSECLSTTANKH